MAGGGHANPMAAPMSSHKPVKVLLLAARGWVPSMMGFGVFTGSMFLYFTDWKIFMDKVPIYRKKFEEKEPIV